MAKNTCNVDMHRQNRLDANNRYRTRLRRLSLCKSGLIFAGLAFVSTPAAQARETEIVVRVLAQDAKFVGDLTGGASVILRDVRSGRLLAEGRTTGGTGDTDKIMQAAGRAPVRQTPGSATFTARIDINQPTLVELEVLGPTGRQQSMTKVTAQRWIMPGIPLTDGDGWLVELPGLAITPTVIRNGGSIAIDAKVELMCGCPITPGGTWDAVDYVVTASVWNGDRMVSTSDLTFTASPGRYRGALTADKSSATRLFVFARNVKTGNSGLIEIALPS